MMERIQIWEINLVTKKDIRDSVLRLRNEMNADVRKDKSIQIFKKMIEIKNIQLEEADVFCYMNYGTEVETSFFIEYIWKLGKPILLPKVNKNTMDFYYIDNYSELKEGYKGIIEPDTDQELEKYIWDYECDSCCELLDSKRENVHKIAKERIMIMPCVAFDLKHSRIGYGKGFYDRYLSNHDNINTILVAFDCQEVPIVPYEIHDRRPDKLYTESRVL